MNPISLTYLPTYPLPIYLTYPPPSQLGVSQRAQKLGKKTKEEGLKDGNQLSFSYIDQPFYGFGSGL